jgi:hypothetical protein
MPIGMTPAANRKHTAETSLAVDRFLQTVRFGTALR